MDGTPVKPYGIGASKRVLERVAIRERANIYNPYHIAVKALVASVICECMYQKRNINVIKKNLGNSIDEVYFEHTNARICKLSTLRNLRSDVYRVMVQYLQQLENIPITMQLNAKEELVQLRVFFHMEKLQRVHAKKQKLDNAVLAERWVQLEQDMLKSEYKHLQYLDFSTGGGLPKPLQESLASVKKQLLLKHSTYYKARQVSSKNIVFPNNIKDSKCYASWAKFFPARKNPLCNSFYNEKKSLTTLNFKSSEQDFILSFNGFYDIMRKQDTRLNKKSIYKFIIAKIKAISLYSDSLENHLPMLLCGILLDVYNNPKCYTVLDIQVGKSPAETLHITVCALKSQERLTNQDNKSNSLNIQTYVEIEEDIELDNEDEEEKIREPIVEQGILSSIDFADKNIKLGDIQLKINKEIEKYTKIRTNKVCTEEKIIDIIAQADTQDSKHQHNVDIKYLFTMAKLAKYKQVLKWILAIQVLDDSQKEVELKKLDKFAKSAITCSQQQLINIYIHEYARVEIKEKDFDFMFDEKLSDQGVVSKEQLVKKNIIEKLLYNYTHISEAVEKNITRIKKTIFKHLEQTTYVDRLQELAGYQEEWTIPKLLDLYSANNIFEYVRKTGLTAKKVKVLHKDLTQYLLLSIKKNHYAVVIKMANKINLSIENNNNAQVDQKDIHDLEHLICLKMYSDKSKHSERLLAQYYHGFMFRQEQEYYIDKLVDALPNHLGNNNYLVQVKMGGGKTKVILPQLAKEKARGNNLVVIEVLPALFETNVIDLNIVSRKMFGQRGITFIFDRSTDISIDNLSYILGTLKHTIVNKDYLITTGESVQSLNNRYIELLVSKPSSISEIEIWKQQVNMLEKCVKIFRYQGDAIIDEIDEALKTRQLLNYDIGQGAPLSPDNIDAIIALFDFFKHVNIAKILQKRNKKITIQDVIMDNSMISTDEQCKQICECLAVELVKSKKSPLLAIINHLNNTESKYNHVTNQIFLYLKGAISMPACISKLHKENPVAAEQLVIYKEQITSILLSTFDRKLHENYGPSKLKNIPSIQRCLAIPYAGNNKPKEFSKFGNCLESINYTILLVKQLGICEEAMKDIISSMQLSAKKELTTNHNMQDSETESYKLFREVFNDAKLTEIDVENSEAFASFCRKVNQNDLAIRFFLKNFILNQIKVDERVLYSNAQSHASMYRSIQGISGTIPNRRTFLQRIVFDDKFSKDIDTNTKRALLQKNTQVSIYDSVNSDSIVNTLVTGCKQAKNLRAIIDVGAVFRGVDNKQVAIQIAKVIKKASGKYNIYQNNFSTSASQIQYVLFFDSNNQISAVKIGRDSKKFEFKIIKIGTSDKSIIANILKCDPSKIFSYYDQAHTRGVDIKQSVNSHAIVTCDKSTTEANFLQGVMRMRDLQYSHSVEIFITKQTASVFNQEKITIEHVLARVHNNQVSLLKDDQFLATLQKIENIYRNDLLARILKEKNIDKKHKFKKAFANFFIRYSNNNMFEQFGDTQKAISVKNIFATYAQSVHKEWKKALVVAKIEIDNKIAQGYQNATEAIRNISVEYCHSTMKYNNNSMNTEVQQQSQIELHQELYFDLLEHQQNLVAHAPTTDVIQYIQNNDLQKWFDQEFKNHATAINIEYGKDKYFKENFANLFGDNIYVTQDFAKTIQGKNCLDLLRKKIHAALIIQNKQGGLKCLILSLAEAGEFTVQLMLCRDIKMVLITPGNLFVAGNNFHNIAQRGDYVKILEQLSFINGSLDTLVWQKNKYTWFSKDNLKKICGFFDKYFEQDKVKQQQMQSIANKVKAQSELDNKGDNRKDIDRNFQERVNKLNTQLQTLNNDIDQLLPNIQANSAYRYKIFFEVNLNAPQKPVAALNNCYQQAVSKYIEFLNIYKDNLLESTSANGMQVPENSIAKLIPEFIEAVSPEIIRSQQACKKNLFANVVNKIKQTSEYNNNSGFRAVINFYVKYYDHKKSKLTFNTLAIPGRNAKSLRLLLTSVFTCVLLIAYAVGFFPQYFTIANAKHLCKTTTQNMKVSLASFFSAEALPISSVKPLDLGATILLKVGTVLFTAWQLLNLTERTFALFDSSAKEMQEIQEINAKVKSELAAMLAANPQQKQNILLKK